MSDLINGEETTPLPETKFQDEPEAPDTTTTTEETPAPAPPVGESDGIVIEDVPDLVDRVLIQPPPTNVPEENLAPAAHDEKDGLVTHDQLPSVEQYKGSVGYHAPPLNRRTWYGFAGLVVCVVILVIIGLVGLNDEMSEEDYVPSQRLEAVKQFLFDNDVSNLPILMDVRSPQHKAAAFVADGDLYQIELSQDNVHRLAERYILALIYYYMSGKTWLHRLNFLAPVDHCDWWHKFTTTKGREIRQGVRCDEEGRVVEINLSYNGLNANSLPQEIQYLAKMETLHLYSNAIGGYFPEFFKKMPNLRGIGLMHTNIRGTLPSWIGTMTQLTTLALSNNYMHGKVPTTIGHLKNLKLLALDGNKFQGDVAMFKGFSKMEALFLDNNQFLGELAGFDSMKKLVSLDVSHNHLYGTMPEGLMKLPSLEVLDVSHNTIHGDFPSDIMENNKLEYLSANDNDFTGALTARIAFIKGLKHLDVSGNRLTSTIPDTIGQMSDLRYLNTAKNKFDKQEMFDLSRLTNLVDLSFKGNKFHGQITTSIGKLENLILLDLGSNQLTGTIPKQIQTMMKLNFLLLNRNKLSGDLPVELNWLHKLQVLLLDKNDFHANAQTLCDANLPLTVFVADCYPESNSKPQVDCRCCTQCCMDLDYDCNNKEWTANVDLQYEYGYERDRYTFSIRDVPIYEDDNQEDQPLTPEDPNLSL